MSNEPDTGLTRLFAHAREPLAEDSFTVHLLLKIERARRARMRRRILAIAAVAVIVLLDMRLVLERTAAVVRFAGDHSPAHVDMLITPWGWAVSMLIGLWVVLRTRPARR